MSSGLKGWGRAILDQVVGNCISSFFSQPSDSHPCGNRVTSNRTDWLQGATHPTPQRKKDSWLRNLSPVIQAEEYWIFLKVIQPQEFCWSLSRLKSFFFKSSPKSCIPAYPCVYAPEPFDKLQNTGKIVASWVVYSIVMLHCFDNLYIFVLSKVRTFWTTKNCNWWPACSVWLLAAWGAIGSAARMPSMPSWDEGTRSFICSSWSCLPWPSLGILDLCTPIPGNDSFCKASSIGLCCVAICYKAHEVDWDSFNKNHTDVLSTCGSPAPPHLEVSGGYLTYLTSIYSV